MKKVFAIFVCLMVLFSLVGCDYLQIGEQEIVDSDKTVLKDSEDKSTSQKESGSDKRVLKAIKAIRKFWNEEYEKYEIEDKYLEIASTKIININDNINPEEVHGKDDMFKDIDYIVEFELISNYFNTTPYYYNVYFNNCVVIYKNGTTKVSNNPFNIYRSLTYSNDFSPIIESIENFNGEYDQVLELK